MLTEEQLASAVGLAYLKLAYRTHPKNSHYLKVKRRMSRTLGRKRNPMAWLVSKKNEKYLRLNLPGMQYLLNVAIGRAPFNRKRVRETIDALRTA